MEIVQDAVRFRCERSQVEPRECRRSVRGSFRRSEGCVRAGDMLVKKGSGPEGQLYKAYMVTTYRKSIWGVMEVCLP